MTVGRRTVDGMWFGILGQLTVRDGSSRLTIPGTKQRALLALLLANHGQPVTAERLVDELWGEQIPAKARNALQAKVSGLRGALAPGDPERGRMLVRADDGGYWLDVDGDAIDAVRFGRQVTRARSAADAGDHAHALTLLDEALTLWRGEPIPELRDYPFAAVVAEHFTGQYLTAIELHATQWLADVGQDDPPALAGHRRSDVADRLLRVLADHPLRESLRAAAMRVLARLGRQAEAIELFTAGRKLLVDQLGVDPGTELHAAHADVLAPQPTSTNTDAAVIQLPAETTSFVGRRQEEHQLRDLLDNSRLVTVTGPGGIGKTRLVVHTLAAMPVPANGIWFADLRDVGDCPSSTDRLSEIADAVLRTVRDRDGSHLGSDERVITERHRAPLHRMSDGIGDREAVLVLDNCEHVAADVAGVARQLLSNCPRLTLVTTTRALLGLPEEAALRLEPLPVPPADADRSASLASDAVRLFGARARWHVDELSDEQLRHATAVVRRTEGIPLAMEVAAGLLRSMPLADLAQHLHSDGQLLNHGIDSTLSDTIDRSWRLLGTAETDLLTRVATIEGRWGLDAAYALSDPAAQRSHVAATVARLVDRSLVSYDPAAPMAPYRLLEPIRDYAARRLTGHRQRREISLAHAHYFRDLAERTDPMLRSAHQPDAFALLSANHTDVLTAIRTLLDEGQPHDALRAATSLGWFWWLSGRRRQGRAVLRHALATLPDTDAAIPLARNARAWAGAMGFTGGDAEEAIEECITALGELPARQWDTCLVLVAILVADRLYQRGEPERGRRLVDGIEEVADRDADEWTVAAARLVAGIASMLNGRLDEGRHVAQAALAGFSESEDVWGQTQALDLLAGMDEMAGDYRGARHSRERVIELAEALGLRDVHAYQLVRIGNLCMLEGDLDAAERLLRHARDFARRLGIAGTVAYADNGIGQVLRRSGQPHQAQVRHEAALRHYRAIGSVSGVAFTSTMLGLAASAAGDDATALDWHRRALRAAHSSGDRRAVAIVLEGLAVATGPTDTATVLLGTAQALRADAGAQRPPGEVPDIDRVETEIVHTLAPDVVERGTLTGKTWANDVTTLPARVAELIAG